MHPSMDYNFTLRQIVSPYIYTAGYLSNVLQTKRSGGRNRMTCGASQTVKRILTKMHVYGLYGVHLSCHSAAGKQQLS